MDDSLKNLQFDIEDFKETIYFCISNIEVYEDKSGDYKLSHIKLSLINILKDVKELFHVF